LQPFPENDSAAKLLPADDQQAPIDFRFQTEKAKRNRESLP